MVEQMPQFPGGDRELLSFIAKNLHYPTIAQEKEYRVKCLSALWFRLQVT